MSRSSSKRSIAPIRPSSPYEMRSFSSTWAGRPLPRRPATYFTSGAYVRMRRSRTPWSFVFAYSRQRAWVSSSATRREYGSGPRFPQVADTEGEQPEADRACSHHHHDQAGLVVDGLGRGRRDPDEDDREHEEQRAERGPGRRRGHGGNLEPVTVTAVGSSRGRGYNPGAATPRGVAQLAEHRSPKPGVAGSSPAAPVILVPSSARWSRHDPAVDPAAR